MFGSKVEAILLDGQILPIGEVVSGRVCACSLPSRLVMNKQLSSSLGGFNLWKIVSLTKPIDKTDRAMLIVGDKSLSLVTNDWCTYLLLENRLGRI